MSGMAPITPSVFDEVVSFALVETGDKPMANIMVLGPVGIGKTSIIWQFAERHGMRVAPLHLTEFDPSDLKGLPVCLPDGTVKWLPSSTMPQEDTLVANTSSGMVIEHLWTDVLKKATDITVLVVNEKDEVLAQFNDPFESDVNPHNLVLTKHILQRTAYLEFPKNITSLARTLKITVSEKALIFLDEFTAADVGVQKACLQLCNSRRIGDYIVPRRVPLIAAGNHLDDHAYVSMMSAASANRFCFVNLVANFDEWKTWAIKNRVSPLLISFLQANPRLLSNFNAEEFNNGKFSFATPRTYGLLSKQMSSEKWDHLSKPAKQSIIHGFIGSEAGILLETHVDQLHRYPTPEEILSGNPYNWDKNNVTTGGLYSVILNLCYVVSDRYKQWTGVHGTKIDKDHLEEWKNTIQNFCTFLNTNVPPELGTVCVTILKELDVSLVTFINTGTAYAEFGRTHNKLIESIINHGYR